MNPYLWKCNMSYVPVSSKLSKKLGPMSSIKLEGHSPVSLSVSLVLLPHFPTPFLPFFLLGSPSMY